MRRFLSRKGRFSLRQSKSGTRSAAKDFYLGLPATNQNWPEEFGFRLGGAGPSYILTVVEGSSAYLAGLQPGDQVVDIEGQDVTNLSTPALIALAQTLKTVPPSIGVVSRIEQININPGPDGRFGFTIVGDSPLMVEDCMANGPAGRQGLKAGDYVLEVSGVPVKQHDAAAAMIKAAQGRPLRLGVLSMAARRPKRLSSSMRVLSQSTDPVRDSRAQKALEFNQRVEEVLGEEPDVKEELFEVLKQYATERDVDSLADALPDILINDTHQQLIDSIRIFIPKKHRERFDEVVSQSLMSRIKGRSFSDPSRNRLRRSRSDMEHPERLLVSTRASSVPRTHAEEGGGGGGGGGPPTRGVRKTTSLISGHSGAGATSSTNCRTVRVCKGNMSFGFTLRGHAPVWIDSVIPGSPADKAGLKPGDRILFLNGLDMRTCSHEKVVSMLQGSGAMPTLVVENGPPTFSLAAGDSEGGGGGVVVGGLSGGERARSPAPLSSLQWVAEILPPSIRVQGRTFGQQLEHLLTLQERYAICKALENFFQHRNVDTLIVDVFPVLDTPAKQVIWQFIYQLLTYEEQEHCQSKMVRFLGFKSITVPPPPPPPPPPPQEPDSPRGVPEPPHRRSSSMRVTGTAYQRSSTRGRSSDDLVIGTHLGMGSRSDAVTDTMMRLAPGERQSGDGTSLPETPNNLANLSAVYAELENMYSGKRSKSLKSRPPPPQDSFDMEACSPTPSPTLAQEQQTMEIQWRAGSRKAPPPLPAAWTEPLPSPPLQGGQFYPQQQGLLTSQTSGESNPYISLDDSAPPSPPEPPDYPASPPQNPGKRRYTFSRPPRSEDTERFLDALSEQLGHRVDIVDDFLTPDNDYEEDVVQMTFPDDEDDDEDEMGVVVADDITEVGGGFVAPELSSPSDVHSDVHSSSSGEENASSLTYSSCSDHIPPHPVTPPPPPPVQFNDPPPPPASPREQQQPPPPHPPPRSYTPDHSPRMMQQQPPPPPRSYTPDHSPRMMQQQPPPRTYTPDHSPRMQQQQPPPPHPPPRAYTPDHSPRMYVPVRRKSGPPPPPPPRGNALPKRHSLHKVRPNRDELQARATIQELKAFQERQQAYEERQAYERQQQAYEDREQQAYKERLAYEELQQQQQQAYKERQALEEQKALYEQQQQQQLYQEQQAYKERQYEEQRIYEELKVYQEQQILYQERQQQAYEEQKAFEERQQAYQEAQQQQKLQQQQAYQGHQSLPAQASSPQPLPAHSLHQLHQSLPPLPSPESVVHHQANHPMYKMRQAQQQQQQQALANHPQRQSQRQSRSAGGHAALQQQQGQQQYPAEGVYQSRRSVKTQGHHASAEMLHQMQQAQQHHASNEMLHQMQQAQQAQHASNEMLHQMQQQAQHHASNEMLHQMQQAQQVHHASNEMLHQMQQAQHHASNEMLHQMQQQAQHHGSTEMLHQAHKAQTHHSSMELLHQAHHHDDSKSHHSSTDMLHQAHHHQAGRVHHSSSAELLREARHDPPPPPPAAPAQFARDHPHGAAHQSRSRSVKGQAPQQERRLQQDPGLHHPQPTKPSPQRPRSVQQQSHSSASPHNIQHIIHHVAPPQPLPQDPKQQQIHLIHRPQSQEPHRPQPLLSTFQPLQPHQHLQSPLSTFQPVTPAQQQHHPQSQQQHQQAMHASSQTARPHSQPSHQLHQSQPPPHIHPHQSHHRQPHVHGQPQSLPHSLSDPCEQQHNNKEPPPAPPLPPPCSPPPLPRASLPRMDSNHMSVKRLRWEQVENSEGTIWGQLGENSDYDKLNDMVKYLDLELHFGTQKSAVPLPEPSPQPDTFKKKDVVEILSHKKAHNASILIAHLKLSPGELRKVLMTVATDRLEPAHIKQLLNYAPDAEEVKRYDQYRDDPGKLSEPDQFVLQMLSVPEYKMRLQSLHFKCSLQEKIEEMRGGYECIYNASMELKTSKKLAKILEFVLAMGNYLNTGQPKSNKTTGFKINFLTELSTTKTVDGKSTFLHILIKSLCQHFPDVLDFSKDLTTVPLAAKVNQRTITSDLDDLHSTIQEIRAVCQKMPATAEDRFAVVMSNFLETKHPALQSLESLQQRSMEEFNKTATYFGEDSKSTNSEAFFGIFSEFIGKFERALSDQQVAEHPKSPMAPRMASPMAW